LVSSPEDAWALDLLRGRRHPDEAATPSSIAVVPNGVDLEYFAPQQLDRTPATLVFSGKMSYHANTAAALFLAQDIMPLVWARRPDVRLVIAGSSPPAAVQALAADRRIQVTGYLPDLRPAIAGATLAVCPLRYGVGIQNKVLEAMALATPAVVARQAARALAVRDRHDLLLAEQPAEYADAILTLLDDPARAARLGAAGRRYVERHHNWDTAAAQLELLYRDAIESTARATRWEAALL
jgi:polysaccharide biosynthesis protein PslH